jgi:hypothetical protein
MLYRLSYAGLFLQPKRNLQDIGQRFHRFPLRNTANVSVAHRGRNLSVSEKIATVYKADTCFNKPRSKGMPKIVES